MSAEDGRHAAADLTGTFTATPLARTDDSLRIDMFETIEAAAPVWRALEREADGCLYNTFDWLSAWQKHVGAPVGVHPLIIVGSREGRPDLLLPLGVRRRGPLTIARVLGDCHGNQNTGLTRRGVRRPDGRTLCDMLTEAARKARIDVLDLRHLSAGGVFDGRAVPPVAPSPSPIFNLPLQSDFDALFRARRGKDARKKLRSKERKLAESGAIAVVTATDEATARALLDTLIRQRSDRAAATGIPTAFDDPAVRAFLTDRLVRATLAGDTAFTIHALEVGGIVRATYVGGLRDGRYYAYSNSIADDELSSLSPGDILLKHLIERMCDAGATCFDFGLGAERYKVAWADPEPLFDLTLPVSARGHAAAAAIRLARSAKRTIRSSPRLWSLVRRLRRLRAGAGTSG